MSTDNDSAQHNLTLARHWIEVFNQRDDAAEAAVRGPGYIAYAPASLEPKPMDADAWVTFLGGFVTAFPDLKLTVVDAVADGEFAAQRIEFEGTHQGEFQGLPPTQRKVSFQSIELNRFADGKVVEHWFQLDALTLLQQLGLIVVPGPRLVPRLVGHQLKKLFRRGSRSQA